MKTRARSRAVKGFVYGGKSISRNRMASRGKTMKGFVYGGKSRTRSNARTRRAIKSFVY